MAMLPLWRSSKTLISRILNRYLGDIDLSQLEKLFLFQKTQLLVARLSVPSHIKTAFWQVRRFVDIGDSRDDKLIVYRALYDDIQGHILGHFGAKKAKMLDLWGETPQGVMSLYI